MGSPNLDRQHLVRIVAGTSSCRFSFLEAVVVFGPLFFPVEHGSRSSWAAKVPELLVKGAGDSEVQLEKKLRLECHSNVKVR